MLAAERATAYRGSVLIVEDDEGFARDVIAVPFEGDWHITFAHNIPQALSALETIPHLDLALVDLNLPGGRYFSEDGTGGGFDVVDRVMRRYHECTVVVLTAYVDARLINAAARRGAQYMVKQGVHEALVELAKREIKATPPPVVTPAAFAASVAKRHALTTREHEVLELSLLGFDRVSAAERLGAAPSTVKHHVRSILRKTGARRLDELRNDLRCAGTDLARAEKLSSTS